MQQSTIWSFLLIGVFTACGGDPHDPLGHNQDPLSTAPTATSEVDAGTVVKNCAAGECPPPPVDWCESGYGGPTFPQWLVEYWDSTCVGSCGDGIIDEGEVCDDGNTISGDGCASACDSIESGFACSSAGQPCN